AWIPLRGLARGSVHLLCALVASGPFLRIFPGSLLRFGANLPPLKILLLELSIPALPIGIMTIKTRTINPVTQLFIDHARDITKVWFSVFFENAFVSRVMRRLPIRIFRFWRSTYDVLTCFGSGLPCESRS